MNITLHSKFTFSLLLLFIAATTVLGQNIDSVKIAKFAAFLEKSELYNYAAEEYERLHYLYPTDKIILERLLANHRKAGNTEYLQKRFIASDQDPLIAQNYAINLIELGNYKELETMLSLQPNPLEENLFHKLSMDHAFIEGDYDRAMKLYAIGAYQNESYISLIEKGKNIRRKSPALAALFSGIVPGTGRVYTKDYVNALISLIFVGSAGYQSYRRFQKNGISSPTGWIYGGISLGFYIGNIYGSYQSAKYYNNQKKKQLNAQFKSHIDMYYSNY